MNTAQGLYQRWTELLQDPGSATKEEIDWTTNELRNSLRSIEWDLEDLDETINILTILFHAMFVMLLMIMLLLHAMLMQYLNSDFHVLWKQIHGSSILILWS